MDEDHDRTAELGEDEDQNGNNSANTSSERKRRQDATFHSLFGERASKITKEVFEKAIGTQNGEMLSLKAIMARQENDNIASTPREYQTELFEKAKERNTIAVLDTGSGKTLIAVLLLKHIIDQELEDRAARKPPRVSFFLVDKTTLVFQQSAVLKANIDQQVASFCGAMGCDLWSKQTWIKHFAENMIIVATPDILYQCLSHAFITMDQINLLIFDEAHHAKKSHAYARIIKDFYIESINVERRPRIFGMTASPVDISDEYALQEKAEELEFLLHSRIATTSHWTELSNFVFRPEPLFVNFARLYSPFETKLYQELWTQYSGIDLFKPLFERARIISSELGRWCSEYYWSFAFLEGGARKYEAKIHQQAQKKKLDDPDKVDAMIAQYNAAHKDVSSCIIKPPTIGLEDLSSKVMKLYELLQFIFSGSSSARCLVFVERRSTARLLKALFDHIGCDNMRGDFLMGAHASKIDELTYSIKHQAITVSKFRNGDLNCLFATSVAEEGLDIQSCGYVIRFDACKTMIQYVQSRGRARQKDSKFFHLMEATNWLEHERVESQLRCEDIMRNFCQALPKDRLLSGNSEDFQGREVGGPPHRVYIEPSTGAKLTYHFSLAVLAHFVGSLPHNEGDDLSINYVISRRGDKFICEVILPSMSPLPRATGREYDRKPAAKRSAAFQACVILRGRRYLDENLLPIYAKRVVAMRNALLPINSTKRNEYPMQVKPEFWRQTNDIAPEQLFITILTLDQPWERPVHPLALITRTRMPDFPSFPLFRSDGSCAHLLTMSLTHSSTFNPSLISYLTGFTLAVYRDIFNKTFEQNVNQMSYWIAPLIALPTNINKEYADPIQLIDWSVCEEVSSRPVQIWSHDVRCDSLTQRFLIDPFHGSRRWFTQRIVEGLRPSDPMPAQARFRNKMEKIVHYSLGGRRKKQRDLQTWDENQPVIQAEEISHRLNVLAQPYGKFVKDASDAQCFLCPGLLQISALPAPVVGMALLFPATIHRIESYLVALEFCQRLGLQITPALALEATTKDADNTDDTQGERINFQHGMGPNYERLEFLGDTFLKMATTIALFAKHAGNNEEEMHIKRMLMLCNQNLYNTATGREYFKYIRSREFSRRTWYPEGLRLTEGKGAQGSELSFNLKHSLGQKTIADVCEAMIGAALLSNFTSGYGHAAQMDEAVKAVSIFVNNDNHCMREWADYYRCYEHPAYQTSPSNASQLDLASQVECEHGYHFKYPRLLRSAFQHSSVPLAWDGIPSYQRLEFLGDSLLDMAAVTYLYAKNPTRDAQWLTEHKMAMVSNKFLGALCVKLGFHRHLRHCTTMIGNQVRLFVQEIEEAEDRANGRRDYWTLIKDAPKCLSDIVESYVGAMFVDSEFNYAEVQRFFDEHILWYFEDMKIYDTFANNHPATRLASFLGQTMGCQEWFLRAADVPAADTLPTGSIALVIIHDKAAAEGHASSGRYAKIKAASKAMERLQDLPPEAFRREYNCHCSNRVSMDQQDTLGAMGKMEVDGILPLDVELRLELDEMIGTAI